MAEIQAAKLEVNQIPDSHAVQSDTVVAESVTPVPRRRRNIHVSLFVIVFVVSFLWNGVQPSTQSYTCMPYGTIVYKLAVCLSSR